MAQKDAITTKFRVDVSELKAGITEANKQIKLANAEFKAASSGMDNWSKSSDGISAKLRQLNTLLEQETGKLNIYKKQMQELQNAYNENGNRADQLKAKLQQLANQGVSKTSDEYKKYQKALTDVEKEQLANQKAIDNLNITLTNQQGTVNSLEKDINNYNKTLEQVEKAENLAAKTGRDLDDCLDEIGSSAKNSGDGFTVMKGAIANLIADGIRNAISAVKDFVRETVNVGKEFDSSMSQVGAVSGATGKELKSLRDKAKEMGSSTKFSASEVADGFNYMAMAGWKTSDMLDGIDGLLNLAAASGSDLATTSDIVTDALTAMGYGAEDASHFADVLAATSSNANTNVELMGGTFKYVAPVAGALGYSMEDLSVAIGLMANAGIKGEQAGTSLRSVMSRLASPPKEAADAMDELGISITNADGTMKPLNEVLEIMRGKFDGLSESQQAQYAKAIAGQEAMSGLLAIVNASPQDFDKLTKAVNNSNGAAEKMAKTMQDNLGGDLTTLGSNFESLQLTLYEKLEPALRKGAKALNKIVDAAKWCADNFGKLKPIIIPLAGAFGLLATKLAIVSLIGAVTKGFAALNAVMAANPITLFIGAIVALVAYIIHMWKTSEEFRNFWIGVWESIKNAVGPVIESIGKWFSQLWADIKTVWDTAKPYFKAIWEGIKALFEPMIKYLIMEFQLAWYSIKLVWDAVIGYFKLIWDSIKTIFSVVKAVLSGDFEGAWNAIKEHWSKVKDYFLGIWNNIKEVFSPVINWFSDIFGNAWTSIKNKFKGWASFWSGLWNTVKSTFSSLGTKIGDAIGGAVKTGINGVISLIEKNLNKAVDLINGAIGVINKLPGVKVGKVGKLHLPRLATGGVLKKGQMGLLEGSGAEAVVPLEKNKAWISKVADDMRKQLQNNNNFSTNSLTNNNTNNFTQIINAPKQPSRIELYRQTRNLLNYVNSVKGSV